jgi:hypothetical protein
MTTKPGDTELFSRLSIHGPRFDEQLVYSGDKETQLLDVDILPDLKNYRDLIVTIARALYLRRTKKTRVKPKFAADFRLHLFKADRGSAEPLLVRAFPKPTPRKPVQLKLVDDHDDFAEARDHLERAVQFLNEHYRLPDDFPLEAIGPLSSFGAGLRDADVIELAPRREANKKAPYTKLLREQVAIFAKKTEFKRVDVVGEFVGATFTPKRALSISTTMYGIVKVPFTSQEEPLIARLVRDRRFSQVRAIGMAYLSAKRGIERFDGYPVVTITPELDPTLVACVDDRLKELEELEPGWLDGDGQALPKTGLEWLRGLLLEMMAHHELPRPRLVPKEEGGVTASWHFRPWYVSAEFDLNQKNAYLHAAEVVTKEIHDLEISFVKDEDGVLDQFASFVLRFEPKEGGRA